ncbi:MAG: Flp pilus assembly protein CpaB [Alphaproteobacteria bacterium]|nr:Flp pilus assembly protein CpaB [Alphaproteobacteria bacterium]
MKPAQYALLGIAALFGLSAVYVVTLEKPAPVATVQAPAATVPTEKILVARQDIAIGHTLGPDNMVWETWTRPTASGGNFIGANSRPRADAELAGRVARQPFVAGEPIRESKLIDRNGAGFMAAILPEGRRAVSTEITAESGAGGFILPNDRVDVIMTRREKADANGIEPITAQVVLSNIRVLAIDQAPKEKDGQNAVIGKTATLELRPDEVGVLTRSRLAGTLSLALRSIADAAKGGEESDVNASAITVYRGTRGQEVLSCNPVCTR